MNITTENKKQKALELMKTLDIYKPYIKGFEKDNNVCFFEGFGGFWAYQEPELMAKIKEFEEKHNCLVYAVTHEYLEFGECYDFLFIPDYEEEWNEVLYRQGRTFYAYAYVWNKTDDYCSEFGTIIKNAAPKQRRHTVENSPQTNSILGFVRSLHPPVVIKMQIRIYFS